MTESEAIKWLREMQNPLISEAELYCAETCYGTGKMVYPEPEDYVFEKAIQALEEVEQYRAIGTVEECRIAVEKHNKKIKPLKVHNRFVCPCCTNSTQEVILTEHTSYCFVCGQAMSDDWE